MLIKIRLTILTVNDTVHYKEQEIEVISKEDSKEDMADILYEMLDEKVPILVNEDDSSIKAIPHHQIRSLKIKEI